MTVEESLSRNLLQTLRQKTILNTPRSYTSTNIVPSVRSPDEAILFEERFENPICDNHKVRETELNEARLLQDFNKRSDTGNDVCPNGNKKIFVSSRGMQKKFEIRSITNKNQVQPGHDSNAISKVNFKLNNEIVCKASHMISTELSRSTHKGIVTTEGSRYLVTTAGDYVQSDENVIESNKNMVPSRKCSVQNEECDDVPKRSLSSKPPLFRPYLDEKSEPVADQRQHETSIVVRMCGPALQRVSNIDPIVQC